MSTEQNTWIQHQYTQEEKDNLHDLYLKLKHIEDKAAEITQLRQDIRDELIPDIADGDIVMERIPHDVIEEIDFIERKLQALIDSLHAAQIG